MIRDVILDGTNPGGNLGAAFTTNINATQINPKGAYLDHLIIGIKGTVSTAPVTIQTVLKALAQFTFKAGQETRIQLSGVDLVALMAAWYHENPFAWQNTDNTGSTFVLGIKVPIKEAIQAGVSYTYSATYAAQTNFSSPVLSITGVYYNTAQASKGVIAVPIPFTTPGATGSTGLGTTITNLGTLQGILLFNTTAPSDGADLYDIQRMQMVENGAQTSLLLTANPDPLTGIFGYADGTRMGTVLQNYAYWDFTDEPYDVNSKYMQFLADVEVVSETTRLIPIITKQ